MISFQYQRILKNGIGSFSKVDGIPRNFVVVYYDGIGNSETQIKNKFAEKKAKI